MSGIVLGNVHSVLPKTDGHWSILLLLFLYTMIFI